MEGNDNDDGNSAWGGWKSSLLEKMRQTAADPDSSFPKSCRAVYEHIQRQPGRSTRLGAVGTEPEGHGEGYRPPSTIEHRLSNPGPLDRTVALAFFFKAAAFVREATPEVLAKVSNPEIRFLALCLGLDPGPEQSDQDNMESRGTKS
jgi:hypothetical protein